MEEKLVRDSTINESADFNIYYFPTNITSMQPLLDGYFYKNPLGHAIRSEMEGTKVIYITTSGVPRSVDYNAGIAAHEIAHHRLFLNSKSLEHPWNYKDLKQKEYIRSGKEEYPLLTKELDTKRLMFPQGDGVDPYPTLLLKEECDKLHGLWEGGL